MFEKNFLRSASEYKAIAPMGDLQNVKRSFDRTLKDNFNTRQRFVVVCGPCSADDPTAMEQYLRKLKRVSDKCDNLLLVARIYTSKPHSNGVGYKGSAFHLHTVENINIDEGILRCRKMMLKCLEIGLPVADELLYPYLYECFDDLASYWFVGARSSEDSLHRDIASGLDVCCGVKNATDGNIDKVVDSLFAVSNPCVFPYNGAEVHTNGNKFAHIVLRGGQSNGFFTSNITPFHIKKAKASLREKGLNDFVMADLNHANSGKIATNQTQNAQIAMEAGVDGIMVESYLYEGERSDKFGVSQTDDCIGFDTTEKLLLQLNKDCDNRR